MKRLGLILLLSLQMPLAWGVACDAVFTNGVQSHNPGGQVQLGYQVEIDGGSDELSTANLNMQSPPGQATCDGSPCTASGSPAASSTPAFVSGNGSDGAVNITGPGNNNLGAGDYTSISVNGGRRLTFNDANSTYLMESLTTGFQSELRFRPGDYWIDGNMNIGQETELDRHGGGGTVRIFVNGDVQLNYQVFTNDFAPGELLIYATGNITLAQEVEVAGFFYAGGNMQVGYLAEVDGAVSGGSTQVAQWAEINYDGGALVAPDFAPFCDAEDEEPAALVSHWAMDELVWDGTLGEVLDSSGNGNHATANDAVTDETSPAIPGNPGTCRYGVFDGSDDYLTAPNLSATLNATASLAFWINTTQNGDNTAWSAPGVAGVEQNGGTDDIFWGWLDAAGRIGVAVGNDNTTKSNSSINNGSWRHVVLTRDHQAGTYQVFIDGALDASGSIAGGVIGTGYSSIGRVENTGGAPTYLEALLDEVHVFDGVLTPAEVSALMMQTRPCQMELCPDPDSDPLGGLPGDYYNSIDFSGGVVGTRVDGPVNFDWGGGAPGVSGVNANQFSVDWTGYIRATETGDYRFQTVSDDGVRLWVDGQLVIQRWNDHAATTDTSGPVSLVAGQVYPIQLQFYENGGQAEIRLRWQTPSGGGYVPIPAGPTPSLGQGLYHCSSTAVDHYTISHSGNGVTCEAEPITITARDSAGNAIAPPAGTEVTLGTTPGTGVWVGGNLYTFTGIESQFTVYLQQTTPATLNIDVTDGTATEIASADPDITFADTGLRFYDDITTPGSLSNQVAGTPDPDPVLRIVQTDSDTGACVARVQNQTLAVNLGYECVNPTTCVGGQTLSLNGTAVTPNNNGAAINYTPVNLNFDNAGFAGIPLIYTDVGQVQLHGQISLPADGNDPAVNIAGSSDEFVVKPYTLEVLAVEDVDGNPNPVTEESGDGFVPAGTPFVVRVEARNSLGNATPNYGNEIPSEVPRLEFGSLVYPAGGDNGSLTGVDNFSAQGNGVAENGSVTWSEVGSITLTPRLTGDDYLGAGDLVSTSPSSTIGRFYPFDYAMVSSTAMDNCGFTYMSEPAITVNYTLQARNTGGLPVLNYDNADSYGENYAYTATVDYVAENADDGNDLSSRVSAEPAPAPWAEGVMTVSIDDVMFERGLDIEAPLTALQLGLRVIDPLDGRSLDEYQLDMNPTTTGDCTVPDNCNAKMLGSPLELRYGRLFLASAYGPEVLDLPVRFTTEFYNGERWQRNNLDSCTAISRSDVTYPNGTIDNDANLTVGLGASVGNYGTAMGPTDITFTSGKVDHFFSASGVSGSFIVTIDLDDYPWLQFDWDNHDNETEVLGTYEFGSYRGHDRIIYWREVF